MTLYRIVEWNEGHDAGHVSRSVKPQEMLVVVEPTDRICITHDTRQPASYRVLGNECHDHIKGGQACVMVDVVRVTP